MSLDPRDFQGVNEGYLLERHERFQADPQSVSDEERLDECSTAIDAYVDWKLNSNFSVSFIGAFAQPKAAAEQGFGRTDNFTYGMIYVFYSY